MRTQRHKFLEALLLGVGILGVGTAAWSVVRERTYESWTNWAFDRRSDGEGISEAIVRDRPGDRNNPADTDDAEPEAAAPSKRSYRDADLLGRLTIPRLGIKAIVREGTSAKILSLSLGHIAGTANPGENGNVGVAGHRDTLFRGLRNVRTGDRIVFETAQGNTYTYCVENMSIVKPEDVGVLCAGLYPEMTLVTCYPFHYIGPAPYRYIVKARQVGQTAGLQSHLLPMAPRSTQADETGGAH